MFHRINNDMSGSLRQPGRSFRQQILWNPDFHVAMAQYRYDQEHGNSRNKSHGQNKSHEYSVHDNRIPKLHLPPMRSSPLPSARIPRGRRMGHPSARMSRSDSSSYSHDYATMAAGLGKKTLNKINRQGREIDDMDYAQDRIYYKLGQAGRHADDLNKGMWFSLCWEPLVNVIKTKILKVKQKSKDKRRRSVYQNPENDHSADEDAGFAAMKRLADQMNTGLKQQNSKLKQINDKQVRNKNKMDQVQSKLNKNLDN